MMLHDSVGCCEIVRQMRLPTLLGLLFCGCSPEQPTKPIESAPKAALQPPLADSEYVRRHGWNVPMDDKTLSLRMGMVNTLDAMIRVCKNHEKRGGTVSDEWLMKLASTIIVGSDVSVVRVWRDAERKALLIRYQKDGVEWEDVAFEAEVVYRGKSQR